MILLDGKKISEELNLKLKEKISLINEKLRLDLIIIGKNPASLSYIKAKEKACEKVGITSKIHALEEDIAQEEVIKLIEKLNKDKDVTGILLQLPVPNHLDEELLIDLIVDKKDVDGFCTTNQGKLFKNRKTIYPATPYGIIRLLDSYEIELLGKNCVVIGRSSIVGMPIAKMLIDRNATVTVCHSKTKDISLYTKNADLVVVAIGEPKFLKKEMIKDNAIIIDVGINRVEGKIVGDCDFESIKDKVGYVTPVPGGVGPMTISSLLENTFNLSLLKNIS